MQGSVRGRSVMGPSVVGLVVAVVAAAILLPGLADAGLWSEAELPVADRARAALGEPLSGLIRSPWLPDWVRTRSYAIFGGELGLRLPHALCTAGLVGCAAGLARALGRSIKLSLLTGAFALALPTVGVTGRTLLGNPIGELAQVLAVLTGLAALARPTRAAALPWVVASAGLLACSVASTGLVLGAVIPLAALSLAAASPTLLGHDATPRRWLAVALAAAAALSLAIGVTLSLQQGDGYIPLLGASKDPVLMSQPQARRFATVLEDFGYHAFPWAGLVVAGAVQPRARWAGLWTVTAVAVAGGWSLSYGAVALPVTVPAALCATFAAAALLDPQCSPTNRRVVVFFAIAGALVLRKDATLHPSRLVVPHYDVPGEHNFPAEPLHATARLKDIGKWGILAMLLAVGVARRREGGRIERALSRIPDEARDTIAIGGLGAAAVAGGFMFAHVLVPQVGMLQSPKGVMDRFEAWAEAGALPEQLAVHRIRDPGLALYGPDNIEVFQSRRQVMTYLQDDEPRVALVRTLDVPSLHQHARLNEWPLFVLDDSHARYRLVANRLPADAEDRNEIPSVVLDEPPDLEHQTKLRFENYIEIIGWEVDEPLVRGQKATLRLAIEVLRPLPGGTKIYTRFLSGRLFRINRDEHGAELAKGLYPPNLWREGDYILHEYTFDVPPLEIWPGSYDFVIGLRRSQHKNFDITIPESKKGEHGVVVRDKKRNFAKIGEVQVW